MIIGGWFLSTLVLFNSLSGGTVQKSYPQLLLLTVYLVLI